MCKCKECSFNVHCDGKRCQNEVVEESCFHSKGNVYIPDNK